LSQDTHIIFIIGPIIIILNLNHVYKSYLNVLIFTVYGPN